jgi:hypothetical protein
VTGRLFAARPGRAEYGDVIGGRTGSIASTGPLSIPA